MKLLIPGLRRIGLGLISVPVMSLSMTGCHRKQAPQPAFADFVLNYDSAPDPLLQQGMEAIDRRIRSELGMTTEQSAAGVLDLRKPRVAMLRPDREEYAASVAKIGILLA